MYNQYQAHMSNEIREKDIERKRVIDLITSRYECPEICAQEINEISAADVAPVVHGR